MIRGGESGNVFKFPISEEVRKRATARQESMANESNLDPSIRSEGILKSVPKREPTLKELVEDREVLRNTVERLLAKIKDYPGKSNDFAMQQAIEKKVKDYLIITYGEQGVAPLAAEAAEAAKVDLLAGENFPKDYLSEELMAREALYGAYLEYLQNSYEN